MKGFSIFEIFAKVKQNKRLPILMGFGNFRISQVSREGFCGGEIEWFKDEKRKVKRVVAQGKSDEKPEFS